MEITINARQAIAAIWTLIAVALSLMIVLAMGFPVTVFGTYYGLPWWLQTAVFFGLLLVITLPVYLLIALWGMASKSESE